MKVSNPNFAGNRGMADDQRSRGVDEVARDAGDATGSGSGNYDVFNDEIKVYKYEGEQEPPASETLSEDKRVLVTDVEENIKHSEEESLSPEDKTHLNGLLESPFSRGFSSFSSFIPPYPYPGCSGPFGLGPVSVPHHFPFYNEFFAQPPPAHMGFPSWSLATPPGFCPPTPMYGLPGQASPFYGLSATPQGSAIYPPIPPTTFYPTGFSPVHTWPHGSGYPFSCFPQLSKFQSPSMLGSHLGFPCPGISHAALVSNLGHSSDADPPLLSRSSVGNSTTKVDLSKAIVSSTNSGITLSSKNSLGVHSGLNPFTLSHHFRHHNHHNDTLRHQAHNAQTSHSQRSEFLTSPRGGSKSPFLTSSSSSSSSVNKMSHIKKPLNAFMLFMKENRQNVIDECTLKESSAINQILGRKWHSLDRAEQMKYYDMARKEKELHRQLYPSWTARDNYAIHARKRRRKEMMRDDEKGGDVGGEDRAAIDCMNAKKCRARYGVEQQHRWCKPCRRKKRCIRFMHDNNNNSDPFDENEDENSSMSARLNAVNSTNSNTNNNNNNPSVADSTTEIFSPSSSTNTDDSRNRCKAPHYSLGDASERIPPVKPHKQMYTSATIHNQVSLTDMQSDFSTTSASNISRANSVLPSVGGLEFISGSTSSHCAGGDVGPFFSIVQDRCSHYRRQQSLPCHDAHSQLNTSSASFADMPSPDALCFTSTDDVTKTKMQEGHLQQAATIF